MLIYLQYFVTWLVFMGLIAGICLLVPALAKKVDKMRSKNKQDNPKQPQSDESTEKGQ